MRKGNVLASSFLIKPSEARVFNFSLFNGTWNRTALSTCLLCMNIHWAQYRSTGYPILHIVQFPFLNATADDMPTQTEKPNVLHYFKACFKVLTTQIEPVANMSDDSVYHDVLPYKPDNFQFAAEMVFDHRPKSSRVMTLLQIYEKSK